MRIIVIGPGRAGGSLAVAMQRAGHEISGIFTRRADDQLVAEHLGLTARALDGTLPAADLLILAVRDDAIRDVADQVAPLAGSVEAAVHLSGLTPVDALASLADAGLEVGSFHPLQTLPNWETGSMSLAGASIAITASAGLADSLTGLAESIGAEAFHLPDSAKALYHAAAAASSNYVLAALSIGERLFAAAGVDAAVARPLVREVVENAFDLGATAALTGPIARGDVNTVAAQVDAIAGTAPDSLDGFKALGWVTAKLAGTEEAMRDVLG